MSSVSHIHHLAVWHCSLYKKTMAQLAHSGLLPCVVSLSFYYALLCGRRIQGEQKNNKEKQVHISTVNNSTEGSMIANPNQNCFPLQIIREYLHVYLYMHIKIYCSICRCVCACMRVQVYICILLFNFSLQYVKCLCEL